MEPIFPYALDIPVVLSISEETAKSQICDPYHVSSTWVLKIQNDKEDDGALSADLTCPNKAGYTFTVSWKVWDMDEEENSGHAENTTVSSVAEPLDRSTITLRKKHDIALRQKLNAHVKVYSCCVLRGQSESSLELQHFMNGPLVEDSFTDSKIVCTNVTFFTHRSVLAAKSSFFRGAFTAAGTPEMAQKTVVIRDFQPHVVQAFLVALYDPAFVNVFSGFPRYVVVCGL